MVERVAKSILEAHSQWELENNRLGQDVVWSAPHAGLLARTAILAMRELPDHLFEDGAALDTDVIGWDCDPQTYWHAIIDDALGVNSTSPA